jgi:hypothetical protein
VERLAASVPEALEGREFDDMEVPVAATPTAADAAMDSVARNLQKHNSQFLEPGETVRAGVFGNAGTTVLQHFLLGGSALRLMRISKDLIFLLTDDHIYVLRGRFWLINRGTAVLEKHARGQVAVASKGLVVRVGQHSLVQLDYLKGSKRGAQFAALASEPPL